MLLVIFGWIVFGTLLGFACVQTVYVWLHCRFLASSVEATSNPTYFPRAAIILCVRGADPSLIRCLTSLARQNYPCFEIVVVADDPADPGLDIVSEVASQPDFPELAIQVINEHDRSRSLKCTGIIQGVQGLNEEVEVVALVDSDAVVDPNWLRDLVQPLADPSVGVTTGNRWFAPAHKNLASHIRQAWNAAAVCQMTCYRIPWGGSLAIKLSTIDQCGLLKQWSTAFCEDTMLTGIMKSNGLRTVRVPSLILSNDESTTFRGTYHWIVRQLLTVRLYHKDWPLVLLHGIFLAACMIAVFVAIILLYLNDEPGLASLILVTWVAFEILYAALFVWIRSSTRNAIESRGDGIDLGESSDAGLVSFLATQLLYAVAVLDAATRRHVSWRGIDYQIGPANKITMLGYVPYRTAVDLEHTSESDTSIG